MLDAPAVMATEAMAPAGLASILRVRTHAIHRRAERSGVVCDILLGNVSSAAYALFLRSLLPAYLAIEQGLDRRRHDLPGLARPEMYRGRAIEADLDMLHGGSWRTIPLLPAAARYAHRAAMAANGDGTRLIAHAYVRYLGDLSGGQMLKKILTRSLGLKAGGLAFHEFPAIADIAAFKTALREGLDQAGFALATTDDVVNEALVAFRLNIHVSEAVQLAMRTGAGSV